MLYAIVAVIVLILDQWMKYWVTANIALNSGSKDLIPGIFRLVNIHNEGAAFSLFAGARWFFVVLAVLFVAVAIFALAKNMIKGRFGRWTAVLTVAGAIGNCVDRVMYGYVVDMFVIDPLKFVQVFNIADLFITFGGILFCIYIITSGAQHDHKKIMKEAAEADIVASEDVDNEHPIDVIRERAANKAEKHGKSTKNENELGRREYDNIVKTQQAKTVDSQDMEFSLEDILDEFK